MDISCDVAPQTVLLTPNKTRSLIAGGKPLILSNIRLSADFLFLGVNMHLNEHAAIAAVVREHARRDLVEEEVYYPDHPPRSESATFWATKREGHRRGIPCAISGQLDGVEYHHLGIEWAFTDAVDWAVVKGVATGEITALPKLDLVTDLPVPGETFPAKSSLLWAITQLAAVRGFCWESFDPAKPEVFVDSLQNMLVLHSKFHRHKHHGIHALSFPVWIFQAFPRRAGFVFTSDELGGSNAVK
jgi:hypothetical protein